MVNLPLNSNIFSLESKIKELERKHSNNFEMICKKYEQICDEEDSVIDIYDTMPSTEIYRMSRKKNEKRDISYKRPNNKEGNKYLIKRGMKKRMTFEEVYNRVIKNN
ncbi:hypothetical protein NUSPORA_02331 [Nucleospora cyclopteri]